MHEARPGFAPIYRKETGSESSKGLGGSGPVGRSSDGRLRCQISGDEVLKSPADTEETLPMALGTLTAPPQR